MAGTATRPLVRHERNGPIALVTIDNPPVNVLSGAVLEELVGALARVASDLEARVVVLNGAAERAFGAGANIREMAELDPAEALVHATRGQAATTAIEDLPLPVIAAVHGSCFGGGTEVALSCDFIIASDDAMFGQPEINLGVMPGWGGTQRLPGRIGPAHARRWILTGKPVTAVEALAEGLVDRVVPRAELLRAAHELATELAGKSSTALAAAKYALNHALYPARDDDLRYERDLWAKLFGTPDQREGMRAFLEKRPFSPSPRAPWAELSRGFPWEETVQNRRAKGKNTEG